MSGEVNEDEVFWGHITDEEEGIIDVVPVDSEGNILFGHLTESECWCYPEITDDGDEYFLVVVHNMFH